MSVVRGWTGPMLLLCVAAGCATVEPQARGFALPDGDPNSGKQAFVDLHCTACHQVSEVPMPLPVADPPVPLVLGGHRLIVPSDGELVTSIIFPEHKISAGIAEKAGIQGDLSRMGDYRAAMTVQQLVDIVAFLRVHYQQSTSMVDAMSTTPNRR